MVNDILKEATATMQQSIEHTNEQLAKIRTGRANPQLLQGLTVDYYGSPTPMQQVANVTTTEARMLTVTPYDTSALGNIEKAIIAANLGLNPNNDGRVIRVVFPELTEERRKDFVRLARERAEEGRIAIRNVRRSVKNDIEELELPEDDQRRSEEELQKITDKAISDLDEILETKEADLMQV